MDDWLHAEREWNTALVLQAFDTCLINVTMLLLSAYGPQIIFNTARTLLPVFPRETGPLIPSDLFAYLET
jgi:hypothetical protein